MGLRLFQGCRQLPAQVCCMQLQHDSGQRGGGGGGVGVADGEAVEKMLLLRVNIIKIHQSLPKTCEKLRFWAAGKDGRGGRGSGGKTQSACVCVCVCVQRKEAHRKMHNANDAEQRRMQRSRLRLPAKPLVSQPRRLMSLAKDAHAPKPPRPHALLRLLRL